MAFGNRSGGRNYGPNAKLYYFKLKSKDLPEPVFEVKRKVVKDGKDDFEVVDPAARFVEGDLIEIANKEFKHDKKTIRSVTATLRDGDDYYFVGIPHTYLGRNILNSLLALKTFEGVQIGVYQSKPKPDPKDPKVMRPGFASSAVRQNGELVYGKFEKDKLPAIPKVKVGDQFFSDDSKITEHFIKEVAEFQKVLKGAQPAATAAASGPASHEPDTPEDEGEPGTPKLPF